MTRRAWAVLVIVGLVLITRLELLWISFFDVDETLFALYTKIWQHGGIPYISFIETKALGVYLFYALASRLSGSFPDVSMTAVHALSILWTLGTTWIVATIATRLFSARAGFFAALLFAAFTTTYVPKFIATNIEVVLLLPLCAGAALLLRPSYTLRPLHSAIAGIFISAAMLCKYQAGIMIPVVLLYYWSLLWRSRLWSSKTALRHTLAFGLGGMPLPIAMVIYLNSIGALEAFWFWNGGGNLFYIESGSDSLQWGNVLLTRALPFLAASALLWILVISRGIATWRARRTLSPEARVSEGFLWIWFFLSIIPVAMGKRFYPHYFLLLFPSAAILAGTVIASWPSLTWRRWKAVVIVAIALPTFAFTAVRLYMKPIYAAFQSADDLDLFKPYAAYLKAHTHPEDRLLVWGYAPTVYWDADRLPATRFLTSGYLSGRVYGVSKAQADHPTTLPEIMPGVWTLFFEDLEKYRPAYIMDMAPTGLDDYENYPMTKYPQLMDYIRQYYVEETIFEKAPVYRRIR